MTIPTKLKSIKGTGKPSRINPNEPDPEVDIPSMPEHLGPDAVAEWRRITPILESMGLISNMDMVALAMYCAAWGRHVKAELELDISGETEKTSNGNLIQSPWVGISNQAMTLAEKFLSKFGLTPMDRRKVSATKKVGANPVGKERFFK